MQLFSCSVTCYRVFITEPYALYKTVLFLSLRPFTTSTHYLFRAGRQVLPKLSHNLCKQIYFEHVLNLYFINSFLTTDVL